MKSLFVKISLLTLFMTGLLHADSTPVVSRVYGNQYTQQIPDTQAAGTIGALDSTFGTTGSLSVNGALSGGQAVQIQSLLNGNFLVVLAKTGSNSVVAQYNAEGTIASSATYGTSGIADLGAVEAPQATMLDAQGRLLVGGGAPSGAAGWIKRVSADGDTVTTFTTTGWDFVAGLAQQTSGKIIAVGSDGSDSRIARYNLAGTLDTTFGATGYIVFDGTNGLTSTTGLFSVVVDSSDNIYVVYLDGSSNAQIAKFDIDGALVATFDGVGGTGNGIVPVTYLNSATASTMRIAIDAANDLVVGATVSGNVKVASFTSAAGIAGTVGNFTTAVFDTLSAIVPTSDGKILLIGSDTVNPFNMAVMRLTSTGTLDTTTFNASLGYNLFNIGTPTVAAILNAASIASDGQIYTAGYQSTGGGPTITPYVSRLNNNQYVSQVQQYPNSQEQGNQDLSFGTVATETYRGVTTPINGVFGSLLQQKAKSVVELSTGNMIVGMDGYTNSSGTSTMMFARLTPAGVLDTTYNSGSAYVTTTNVTSAAETLNAIAVDASNNLYVAGTSAAAAAAGGATFRKYNSSGAQQWAAVDGSNGAQGLGVALQKTTRALLFEYITSTTGRISGYNLSTGALDDTFGVGATVGGHTGSGQILTSSYGLNMGPVYGGVVSIADVIYVAYRNSSGGAVSVAAIQANGSGLETTFASSGIYADVLSGLTPSANNIRIGLDTSGKLIVAAVTGNLVRMVRLNPATGSIDSSFNSGAVFSFLVTGATSLQLARLTGVSDGTTMLTMWDDATDDSMMIARILANGTGLDTTFDSQGSQPGVLSLQIGDEVTNYVARTATSAMIQSTTGAGSNKGNIVLAAFEEVTSSDATPMVMRVYGTPGTTEVKDFPITTPVPGTLEAAYDITTLESLSTGSGKVIFMYPNGNAYAGTMLVGVDTGVNSIVYRLDVDTMGLDTTFGTSGTATISGLPGINCISIDSNNNVLVGGTASGAGWAKRLTANGGADVSFTMPSSVGTITAVNGIAQQKSGRYILAAQNTVSATNYPVLVAFKDLGSPLVVDPTFNPMQVGGAGSSQFGIFGLGTTISSAVTGSGLYTVSINSDDTIVAAYASSTVYLAQVTADGSGYVNAFNSGAPKNTTITTDGASAIRAAIDSSGKYVVATSYNTGVHQVQVGRYTTAGAFDTGFNSNSILTISNLGSAGITLTGLMESSTQQTILTGYNTAGGNGPIFAARLTSAGILDSSWNPTPTSPDTPGVLTFGSGTIPAAVNSLSAYIQNDGIVALLGSSATNTSGDVIVMQVYGDDLVYEVVQSQLQLAAGVLDTTLPSGTAGSMRLNGSVYVSGTTVSATISGIPSKIAIYNNTTVGGSAPYIQANGTIMIASYPALGSSSNVTMLNPDLSPNANYGSGGSGTVGIGDVIGSNSYQFQVLNDMYLSGDISSSTPLPVFVTGNDGSAMVGAKIIASGAGGNTSVSYMRNRNGNNITGMTNGYAIRQSTNNRIVIAGKTSSSGAISAFASVTSQRQHALDTTFGNQGVTATYPTGSSTSLTDGGGVYLTGVNSPLYDMAVDSLDRMYIAYYLPSSSGATVNVQRILADGTGIDSVFGTQTLTGSAFSTSTPIRIALDATNNLVYVAAQDGTSTSNIIRLQRFSTADGTPATQLNAITIASKTLTLSDLFIDAQGYSYVVGTNTTDSKSVTARVTSGFALDTANYAVAGGTPGIANVTAGSITSVKAGAFDPDRRTYLVGVDGSNNSYITRLYGDAYTSQTSEAIATGTAGTIDPTFGSSTPTAGYYNLSTLSGVETNPGTGKAIVPLSNGGNYIAVDNGTNSQLFRTISSGALDTAYGGGDGIAVLANPGVNSMMIDGSGRVVLVGTTPGNHGWVQRYANGNTGNLDSGFGSSGVIDLGATTSANVAVEQTLARLVVAGTNAAGHGALFAYTSIDPYTTTTGAVDTTFNFNGATPGVFDTGVANTINSIVADQYDRLIFVQLNGAGNAVLLYRLTPTGELDVTFGTNGVQTLTSSGSWFGSAPNSASQVFVTLSPAGDYIIVAAHLTSGDIGVLACDNGTTNTAGANGLIYRTVGLIPSSTLTHTPVLTGLVGSAHEYIHVLGNQSSGNPMWIARMYLNGGAISLDTAGFNPNAVAPGAAGIFEYAPGTSTVHNYYGLAVRPDGCIQAVGAETISSVVTPMTILVYNDPYTVQNSQTPDSKAVGTNDLTLGLTGSNGVTFFGVPSGAANMNQAAQAVALQDDNNYVVAIHGGVSSGGLSQIMIDKFDTDGLLNLSFNTTGQATITTPYFGLGANQYAQDMATFTTVGGVHKAIVAGYVTMATPSLTGSLLMQYNLDSPALDSSFGGYNGVAAGIAFGDCKQINAVGQQTFGRIIASGIAQGGAGVLLGYTANGLLDTSFGVGGGYQSTGTGSTGLYTHAIDSLNRIVIGYNNSGTVALARFLADGSATDGISFTTTAMATVSADNKIRVAVDSSNNVYVAAVIASNNSIIIQSYNGSTGGSPTNTITKTGSQLGGNGSSNYTLSRLLVDQSGNVVVVAYDSNAKKVLVARFTSSLALDTSNFDNPSGYVLYQPAGGTSSQIATDAMIHPDGRILIVGSEN